MKRTRLFSSTQLLAWLIMSMWASYAHADLLLSTNGGTYLTAPNTIYDEGNFYRALPAGQPFTFFGVNITNVYVNINGYLDLNGIKVYNPPAVPYTGDGIVAPMWDDLYIYPSGAIVENTNAAYYAVTWMANIHNLGYPSQICQAAMFSGDATIQGLSFHAGDIVFSYQSLSDSFNSGNATVTLNKGDGTNAVFLPGAPAGGILMNDSLFPIMGPSYCLFRPNGSGGYNSTITGAPASSVQPLNFLSLAGTNITLTATTYGNGPLAYQWYRNVTNAIPNATNATLTISNLYTSDGGAYTVATRNSYGSETNYPVAIVGVIPPPSDLLIDPTGGTYLTTYPNNYDENDFTRSLGNGNYSLFGAPITAVNVNANGYLNLVGSDSYHPVTLPFSGDGMISALMHDLDVYTTIGDAIIEKTNANYYSATWLANNYGATGDGFPDLIFQIDLFGGDVTIRNVQFHAGDIALSYLYLSNSAACTVGLNKGDGAGYALVPGSPAGGQLTVANQGALLPTGVGSYILFRPDGNGNYSVRSSTGAAAIDIEPQNQFALQGENVTLNVAAAGATPFYYQWYKNTSAHPITGATNAFLALTNLSPADQAAYFVVVTNSVSSVTSAPPALVTVLPKGIFLTPLGGTILSSNSSYDEGHFSRALPTGAFSFFGHAVTNVNVNINGYLDFVPLDYYQNVTLPYSADSMIAPLLNDLIIQGSWGDGIIENSGTGYYAVTWAANTYQAGAVAPSQIFQTILFGGDVTLKGIAFHAGDVLFSYGSLNDDFRNNASVVGLNSTNNATSYALIPGSPTNGVLTDANKPLLLLDGHSAFLFRPDGAGNYISSIVGGTVPVVGVPPKNQTLPAESTANFTVFASGAAPLSYQWYKNSTNPIAGALTNLWVLLNIHTNDNGTYCVVITNSYGSVTSAVAQLTVTNVPVKFTLSPVPGYALAGANFTFTINATGTGPLGYQWFKNGTNLTSQTNAALNLTSVNLSSAGFYSAFVTGAMGTNYSGADFLTVGQYAYVVVPTVATLQLVSAGLPLTFAVQPGLPYRLQTSTNLFTWLNLTNAIGTGVPLSFTDLGATNRPLGFYRIISP